MKETLSSLKNVFFDILKLYKNLFHWNIHKIIIIVFSWIFSVLLALPFVILIIICFIAFGVGDYINIANIDFLSLLDFFSKSTFLFLFLALLFVLAILFLIIGYNYKSILLFNLGSNYIEGRRIKYFSKRYFDFKLFKKYIFLFFLNFLILLIPFFVFILGYIFINISFGGIQEVKTLIESTQVNSLHISVIILFLFCVLIFVYLFYRLIFSFIILIDNKNYKLDKSPFYFIKKSFKKTKGITKLINFLIISLLVLTILFPFYMVKDNSKNELDYIRAYVEINSLGEKEKEIVLTNSKSLELYKNLKLRYGDIALSEQEKLKKYLSFTYYFMRVFLFIFTFGVFEMFFVSFYYNFLNKKENK